MDGIGWPNSFNGIILIGINRNFQEKKDSRWRLCRCISKCREYRKASLQEEICRGVLNADKSATLTETALYVNWVCAEFRLQFICYK